MKKLLFAILGILTAVVIFHSNLSDSFSHLIKNTRLLVSFGIVALTSAYAYFFIHQVLYRNRSDE